MTLALTLPLPRWSRIAPDVPAPAWLMLWAFIVLTLCFGLLQPFPTSFDELQHLSYLRAMQAAPTLMPAQGQLLNLDVHDLGRWTAERNHLNHPPLYYLLFGWLTPVELGVMPLRALNAALTGGAAALTIVAGCRLLPGSLERGLFALASLSFPKTAVIGGTINNDNLALLASAMTFAGVAGLSGAGWWLGAALAIAGWTKLNALIALGAVTGCWLIARRERDWRVWLVVTGGAAIGCVPSLLNLATIGQLLWVDEIRYFTPHVLRPDFDLIGYSRAFLAMFAAKWGAVEYAGPLWACLALMAIPFGLAAFGRNRLVAGYGVALGVTFSLHLWFGWQAFLAMGDLTIPQPRYYAVLWPGLSIGIALALAKLWRVSAGLGGAGVAALLWPTALGGVMIAAI